MARRRRRSGLGFPPEQHRAYAKRAVNVARTELSVVRTHLRRGECGPAIRGIAMAGWALGRAAANREAAGARRESGVGRMAYNLRRAADRIIKTCRVKERRK